MALLPKEHGQFAKEDFWDGFFKARGDKSFDWYGEYGELSSVIHKYIKPADKILMVGCGNSKLSEDLYDLSYHDIHNIDISELVIRQMKQKNNVQRPKMSYTKMDATQMSYENESFKSAIDKGTLDALLPDTEHIEIAVSMLADVWRVVKCMGSYMIVSLAQDHVLNTLVKSFQDRACIFRAHKLPSSSEEGFMMPVFAFVITKLKQIPGMKTVWETSLHEGNNTRHSSSEDMIASIKECQYYAMLQSKLSKGSTIGDDAPQPCVKLFSAVNSLSPRYTIHIVDAEAKGKDLKFAVFIAPQGKENEWMFSTDEGRMELSSSCGYKRLLVVTLNRGHIYKDIDEVKAELSAKVMELAPLGTLEKDAPFLSMAEGIGIRNIIHQTDTKSHGQVYIEDANSEGQSMMRYIYCEIPESTEPYSSANLITRRTKKGTEKTIKASELCCEVERVAASLVCFAEQRDGQLPNLLIVGLKCGTLASFISKYMTGITVKTVSCVEDDGELVTLGREHFSLDNNVKIIKDPFQTLVTSGNKYGCIIMNDTTEVEGCLTLLEEQGVLIIIASQSTENQLESLTQKFSQCASFSHRDKSVHTFKNTELNVKDKKIKKMMYRVKEKVTSELTSMKIKSDSVMDLSAELNKLKISQSSNPP